MTEVGREVYNISDIHGESVKTQWGWLKTKLEATQDLNISEDYNTVPYNVYDYSSRVRHNFMENPPVDGLQTTRNAAPDWRSWLLERTKLHVGNWKEIETNVTHELQAWRNTISNQVLIITSHLYGVDYKALTGVFTEGKPVYNAYVLSELDQTREIDPLDEYFRSKEIAHIGEDDNKQRILTKARDNMKAWDESPY